MLFERQASDAEVLASMLALLEAGEASDAEIGGWLDSRFGHTSAIMIIDMCGFTRFTREKGIVEFLRRMYEVQRVIIPIIQREAGTVLNTLADSLACLFPTVDAALFAATDMIAALDGHNADFPEAPDHYLSIGIGFGRILVIDGTDAFGDEMNYAGKLGEDLADRREILLTPAAVKLLGDGIPLDAKTFEIGGQHVIAGLVNLAMWDRAVYAASRSG